MEALWGISGSPLFLLLVGFGLYVLELVYGN